MRKRGTSCRLVSVRLSVRHCVATEASIMCDVPFSLLLFTVFMNMFIVSIRSRNFGCYQNLNLCVLYADDIVLLSASFSVLQKCWISTQYC